jgi:hypothetical protein
MSAVLLRVPYAQDDASLIFSGNKPDLKEKLITIMEISVNGEAEVRIAALEKRVRDMEALVKGLTAEMLDLRTITTTKSGKDGERSRQVLQQGTVVRGTTIPAPAGPSASPSVAVPADDRIVIRPKGVSQQDAEVGTAEPEMARIMQADGTMKMEPRYGDKNSINSSSGYSRTKKGAPDGNR